MKPIKLKAIRQFGRIDLYPDCDRSALYAALANSRSLNEADLKIIATLGEALDIIDTKSEKSYSSFADLKQNAS